MTLEPAISISSPGNSLQAAEQATSGGVRNTGLKCRSGHWVLRHRKVQSAIHSHNHDRQHQRMCKDTTRGFLVMVTKWTWAQAENLSANECTKRGPRVEPGSSSTFNDKSQILKGLKECQSLHLPTNHWAWSLNMSLSQQKHDQETLGRRRPALHPTPATPSVSFCKTKVVFSPMSHYTFGLRHHQTRVLVIPGETGAESRINPGNDLDSYFLLTQPEFLMQISCDIFISYLQN